MLVIYLMTLTSDLILGHISSFSLSIFEIGTTTGFRSSTSMRLPTIDCTRTSLHGFVETEMDHIRFHPRSIGGSFSQMLMR